MACRETWYDQVDEVLNVENDLQVFFHADESVNVAALEVHVFQSDVGIDRTFETLERACSWLRRVRTWKENLLRDLSLDSVPAPCAEGMRWLLLRTSSLDICELSGAISCLLCKRCAEDLSRVQVGRTKEPTVRMPCHARANGMWRGPDPAALQSLSYCETKVINLARIHVSVKRVLMDRASYARTSKSEAPLYHQKNVVAYPQSADGALRSLV